MIFVGYTTISIGYTLCNFENDAMSVSKDVVFDEHSPLEGIDSSLDLLGDLFDSFSPSSTLHSPSFDDVPIDDGVLDFVDITSYPLWARKTLEDSGVVVSTLELQAFGGPHHSQ